MLVVRVSSTHAGRPSTSERTIMLDPPRVDAHQHQAAANGERGRDLVAEQDNGQR
jgi:hypothetical protein